MMMKVKATGYRVLIKPDPIKEKSDGGIIVVQDTKMERAAQQYGVIVDVGPDCWSDYDEPWANVGDRICFVKHACKFIEDPEDPTSNLAIINDSDILVVLGE